MSKWISVKDRLPEDGTYLALNSERSVVANYGLLTNGEGVWQLYIPGVAILFQPILKEVTHWMPLPDAPSVKS